MYVHNVTFSRVKLHAPLLGPMLKGGEVTLKGNLVMDGKNLPVNQTVICEQTDRRTTADSLWQVIDVYEEQHRAQHRPLRYSGEDIC